MMSFWFDIVVVLLSTTDVDVFLYLFQLAIPKKLRKTRINPACSRSLNKNTAFSMPCRDLGGNSLTKVHLWYWCHWWCIATKWMAYSYVWRPIMNVCCITPLHTSKRVRLYGSWPIWVVWMISFCTCNTLQVPKSCLFHSTKIMKYQKVNYCGLYSKLRSGPENQ